MELLTISQVSKKLGISTRMLRYYEQTGLIKSFKKEGYAYRMYDAEAMYKVEQIILLRKLRIPVRQIQVILENHDAVSLIDIFRQNINGLDEEITALSAIKDILLSFIQELVKVTALPLSDIIAENDTLMTAIESLDIVNTKIQDSHQNHVNNADKTLSRIKDVRILYLPPSAVASAHVIGDDPEDHVNAMLDDFVCRNALQNRKPDLRHYGFNHPNPMDETGCHGYEAWVTIPEDMEVLPPLKRKQFQGGLYGAYMIPFGDFSKWGDLLDWANHNDTYEFAGDLKDQEHMCGLMEEHLNYYHHLDPASFRLEDLQLDLLIPIKKKQKK